MVYRHSLTCSSPRSTLQICIPVKNTMSERTKVRYDKLMKEREGKEKEYYEG